MKFSRVILPVVILTLVSCKPLFREVTSQDCTVAVPAGFTRIYIGTQAHGPMSGTSFDDPLDGSTAEKFDTILRSIAEGQHPTWGTQSNIAPENLIVCMTSGTFQTNGQYDWKISVGHTGGSPLGFTVEKNWKIHGRGQGQTTLQLASYLQDQFVDQNGASMSGGRNVALGTHSIHSSGIEISDLTIDANHDRLTSPGGLPLNLEGIVLRSEQGNHWIHNVSIIGGSGDVGVFNEAFETFAIRIWGNNQALDPQVNTGSIIENVTVSKPGQAMSNDSPAGGAHDGIVVNNAVAEVRNNVVEDYPVAYGGWAMGPVWFHDNISKNCLYGFNSDSFRNDSVTLQSNSFLHNLRYGIVIGGGDGKHAFTNWTVRSNTVAMGAPRSAGIVIRGEVLNATFSDNTVLSDSGIPNLTAIWSYQAASGLANLGNVFQNNHIDQSMSVNFSQDPNFNSNCRYQNRDLQGRVRLDFPDNTSTQCP
ncbi:MAG: hypothetical protein WA738_08640 [Candidatus Angelobacter sp.]